MRLILITGGQGRPRYKSDCGNYIVKQCYHGHTMRAIAEFAIFENGEYLCRCKDLDSVEDAIENAKRG